MSLEDIENLKKRFEKDPNSKLFVPLAEEYRKEGMLEEAIEVLSKGLEKQPDYMSARVSRGKIYVEKGMLEEARAEFEQVISAVPDNLFAHKKLAEIYRDTGERNLAIKGFRRVLKINPMDEDAVNQLNSLEKIDISDTPTTEVPVQEESKMDQKAQIQEDIAGEESVLPQDVSAVDNAAPETTTVSEESLSLPADDSDGTTSIDDELTELQSYVYEDDETVEISEESDQETDDIVLTGEAQASHDDELSFEGIEAAIEAEEPAVEEPLEAEIDTEVFIPEDNDQNVSDVVLTQAVEELSDDADLSLDDIDSHADIADIGHQESPVAVPETLQDSADEEGAKPAAYESVDEDGFFDEADKYIAQGNYGEAISLYNRMLAANPEDTQVLQRSEDLKSLLQLLGKDKEILISKLNLFLERIKNRRNDFYRSS